MKPKHDERPRTQPGEPEEPGDLVRALRQHTHQTQEAAAEKSGELTRTELARIEIGANKCSSGRVRAGLARAFDLHVETMADLLDGRIALAEVLGRVGESKVARASPRLVDRPEWLSVLPHARALHDQFFGPSSPEVWGQLEDVLDSAPFPRPLTAAFLAQLAHALAPPAASTAPAAPAAPAPAPVAPPAQRAAPVKPRRR